MLGMFRTNLNHITSTGLFFLGGGGAERSKLTWKNRLRKTAMSRSSQQLTLKKGALRDQV